ncbi:MAG: hypothetical protein HDS68_00640 [Bacteroidales bacterium]|nr:hypothetical protein [Bacteroidales bacterium]
MNNNNIKQLIIPSNPLLDSMEMEEVVNALEECGARFSIESLNWPSLFPYRPLTVVTAAHSERYLYIDFLVRCNYLRAVNFTDNSPVGEDSCVEFYVSPVPDSDIYWIFELNCVGTINAARCQGKRECVHLNEEALKKIKRYTSVGTRPFQEVEGSFIWNVAMAIPLELLGLKYSGKPIELKGNFNKCASATSQPHYVSWAPIFTEEPDFHRPEFFGNIILE